MVPVGPIRIDEEQYRLLCLRAQHGRRTIAEQVRMELERAAEMHAETVFAAARLLKSAPNAALVTGIDPGDPAGDETVYVETDFGA